MSGARGTRPACSRRSAGRLRELLGLPQLLFELGVLFLTDQGLSCWALYSVLVKRWVWVCLWVPLLWCWPPVPNSVRCCLVTSQLNISAGLGEHCVKALNFCKHDWMPPSQIATFGTGNCGAGGRGGEWVDLVHSAVPSKASYARETVLRCSAYIWMGWPGVWE